jgi:acyl-CoA synthetase (AMP-forming)/AMP-acid ligase II
VDSRAEALAASLHNLGIEVGDRVALVLPACLEFVISMFTAAKIGATIVPLILDSPLPSFSIGSAILKRRVRSRSRNTTASRRDVQVVRRRGCFLTGDLVIVDEEEFVPLVGRRKEVIMRFGFNVYPREVEDRLQAHPAVREAAVVGISDLVLGEAICSCVVSVEGAIVTG